MNYLLNKGQCASDRVAVSQHARNKAMRFFSEATIYDGVDEDTDVDLGRVPSIMKETVGMWLQSFMDAFDLAEKFSSKPDVTIDDLDAIDWLFYSRDDAKGGFGFCCDILSLVTGRRILPTQARLNMLRMKPLLEAKKRFDKIVTG